MSTSGGSGSGGASPVTVATATIHAAGINTLFSAPTQLVAAPGANKMIDVIEMTVEGVPGTPGNWLAPTGLVAYYGTVVDTTKMASGGMSALDMLSAQAIPNTQQVTVGQTTTGIIVAAANAVNKSVTLGCAISDPQKVGGISTFSVNNGGTLYAVGDTGTVDPDNYGGNAAYVVDTVSGGGAVLTMHLTAAGTGYGAGDTARTTTPGGSQPGIGSGLTIDVLTVPNPSGTLYATIMYRIVTTH